MKRMICVLLVLILGLGLCACSQQEEKFQDPVAFYLLRIPQEPMVHGSDDSVITPVIREGEGIRGNLKLLLDRYLADPGTEGFRSPFPARTSVLTVRNNNGCIEITLTDNFAQLSGLDLTLACACLTRTVLDLTGADSVRISVETEMLDGQSSITMDRDDLVLTDEATQTIDNDR